MKKSPILYLIPVLMMFAVPLQTAADDFVRGDCNLDGDVTIKDVTTLIDYLLSDSWDGEPVEPGVPVDGDVVTFVLNGININMAYVSGGTFTMGASGTDYEAANNEYPAHVVTLSPYYICTTEVTQALWRAVMGSNPSKFTGDLNRPVENVTWAECKTFITRLNDMTGHVFRMLTEAEWEFAARGGNKSMGYKYAGSNTVDDVAWYSGNASSKTHPVGTKAPNELGLYDMSGNVYEWVYDYYYGNYSNANQSIDPTGPTSGSDHVLRGGAWYYSDITCRVSARNSITYTNTGSWNFRGLRLAMSPSN